MQLDPPDFATRDQMMQESMQRCYFIEIPNWKPPEAFEYVGAKKQWTQAALDFLATHYPTLGKNWCALRLNVSAHAIRSKASKMGLRIDYNSPHFLEYQARAAKTKVGKKRHNQALVMKRLHKEGKLKKDETQRKAVGQRVKAWIEKNGHPRGMLGKKHTPEAKDIFRKNSKKMWENMSEEQRRRIAVVCSKNGQKATMNRANASWKSAWREIGGKRNYYRSSWEANYARYLEWLKINKEIIEWEHEPKTFWFDGIKRGCMTYLPDFRVITKTGGEEYHEVKGWMDGRSVTKIRRMAKYFPDVTLIVIDAKAYKSIQRSVCNLIKDWEFKSSGKETKTIITLQDLP